jgi:Phage integrase family
MSSAQPLFDAAGRRRSPATMPGHNAGRASRNKGICYPADPPTVDEIVAVMRRTPADRHGVRLRALIVVLWRGGLRIQEALSLIESDLDPRRGSILVRRGKGNKRREVGMDAWAWNDHLAPWLACRVELPVGPLFCVIDGPTRGRPWSATAARGELRRHALAAGVRRRFAPHQYADLIVMPTRPGEVLASANSAVRNIGIIPLHFEGPLGGRCEAANTISRDRLYVWLRARDAVTDAWQRLRRLGRRSARPTRRWSRGRRDRERRCVTPTPPPRSNQIARTPSPASA